VIDPQGHPRRKQECIDDVHILARQCFCSPGKLRDHVNSSWNSAKEKRMNDPSNLSPSVPDRTVTEKHHRSVLLVDDDFVFTQSLGKAFQDRGLSTEIFQTVEDAACALETGQFDIVITDLRIGGRSGLDIVKLVRKKSSDTKLLVLTSYGNVQAAVSAVKLGATEFLSKPADADEILEVLGVEVVPGRSAANVTKPAETVRWEHINNVFRETGENISATARLLNMHRRTLQRMLSRGPPRK
jgi:two-component system, response regulator RegA